MNKQQSLNLSATTRYNAARSNLLLVIISTFLNIVLALAKTNTYLLFSASLPYFLASEGTYLYANGSPVQVLVSLSIIGIVLLIPYLLFWIFSKKHWGWMIAALVYFSIVFLSLLLLFQLQYMIMDILFHAWVLYFLILGVATGKKSFKEKAQSEAPVLAGETPAAEHFYAEDEYGYVTSRSITIERTGSFAGGAVPYTCVFNQDGREKRFTVEKGKSIVIPASSSRYQIKIFVGSTQSDSFIGEDGAENKHYVVDSKYSLFKGMSFLIKEA